MISSGGGQILLLDTDVFSYIYKKDTRRLSYALLLVGFELAISFMTVAEAYQGAAINHWGAKRIADLEQTIQGYIPIMADYDMCKIWARIRAERRAAGHPIEA